MKYNKLILIAIFLSFALLHITSITLISKYQTQEEKINEIVINLVDSEPQFKYNKLQLSEISKVNELDSLKIYNISHSGSSLTTEYLHASFHLSPDNKRNSLEIISKAAPADNHAFFLTLYFDYEYKNETGTFNGQGSLGTKADLFNYTMEYLHPAYQVINHVDIKMSYKDHSLIEKDEKVSDLFKDLLLENRLDDELSQKVSAIIKESLDEIVINREDSKSFVLTRKEPNKKYTISSRESLAYEFDSSDGVISFMEGSIYGEKILADEDTDLPPFRGFDTSLKTDQLFIHNKLFINLFKLGMEKKLATVRQKDINELDLEGVKLDIKWLSQFYPQVKEIKAIDTDFYIEYYVNSVTYEEGQAPFINYSFFFIAEDEEVILKFNVSYQIFFDVLLNETETAFGGKSVNLAIQGSGNLFLKTLDIIAPTGTRLDKNGIHNFVNNLLVSSYVKNPYHLFNEYETFGNLIVRFDSFRDVQDGLIFYETPQEEIFKFLS